MSLKNNSGDRLVDASLILESIAELKRRGTNSLMQELESMEQELAGHVMEELSLIYSTLNRTAASSKSIQRLMHQIQSLVLVTILAMRKSQHRLWDDTETESEPSIQLNSSPRADGLPPAA